MYLAKRIFAGVLATALVFGASACGNSNTNSDSSAQSSAASSAEESERETESAPESGTSELPESAANPGNLLQAMYIGCPKEETEARLQQYGFEFNTTLSANSENSYDTDRYWFTGSPDQICLTKKYYDDSFMRPFIEVSYNDDGLLCFYHLFLETAIPYDENENVQKDLALETINYLWGVLLDEIYGQGKVEENPTNLMTYYQTCWEDETGNVQIELIGGFNSSDSNRAEIKCGSKEKDQPLMQITRIK